MRTVQQILEAEKRNFENIQCIDILKKIGISLISRGNRFVAMCPIHGDKNSPSFTVYPNTNTWTCFSANCVNAKHPGKRNGGGNIDLVMQILHYSYPQTMDWLRKNFNVSEQRSVKILPKKTEYSVCRKDALYYHSLMNKNAKRDYFLNRGFTNETIDTQLFGYCGEGYVIPIWAGEPQNSVLLSIKIRRIEHKNKAKYIRLGTYDTSIYGLWDTKDRKTIFGFAGELDCRIANQHDLPSFSLIDGAKGWNKLQANWPEYYFPSAEKLIVVFDRKEESTAGQMATNWEKVKGRFSADIVHYPPDFLGSDFNEYILEKGIDDFHKLINWCPWSGETHDKIL